MNNNCVVLVEIDGIVLHISRKIFIEFFWTQHWNIEANFMAQSKNDAIQSNGCDKYV